MRSIGMRLMIGGVVLGLGGCGPSQEDFAALAGRVDGLESELGKEREDHAAFQTRVDKDFVSVTRRTLEMGKSGTQTCNEQGQACLFLSTSKAFDLKTDEFVGYTTFFCDTSKIKDARSCPHGFALMRGRFTKARESETTARYSGNLCLKDNEYNHVYCIDTIE